MCCPYKSPKGGSKRKVAIFRAKMDFFQSKSATKKVSLCKIFQRQSCKAFTAYLTVHNWLVGNVPLYLKVWAKMIHPLKNADFESLFARSVSTVTPSKKVQL